MAFAYGASILRCTRGHRGDMKLSKRGDCGDRLNLVQIAIATSALPSTPRAGRDALETGQAAEVCSGVVGAALTSLIMPTGKLQRKRELQPQVNSLREGLRATDAL